MQPFFIAVNIVIGVWIAYFIFNLELNFIMGETIGAMLVGVMSTILTKEK